MIKQKIRVTASNQRLVEDIIGEKVFIDDIVYLPYELPPVPVDLIGIICQENEEYLTIWDEINFLNVDANLFSFDSETVESFMPILNNILLQQIGDLN
jgi:hypothetical protein